MGRSHAAGAPRNVPELILPASHSRRGINQTSRIYWYLQPTSITVHHGISPKFTTLRIRFRQRCSYQAFYSTVPRQELWVSRLANWLDNPN